MAVSPYDKLHAFSVGSEPVDRPLPKWTKTAVQRCRWCGKIGKTFRGGRFWTVSASVWSADCTARPWWRWTSRDHKPR